MARRDLNNLCGVLDIPAPPAPIAAIHRRARTAAARERLHQRMLGAAAALAVMLTICGATGGSAPPYGRSAAINASRLPVPAPAPAPAPTLS